MTTEQTLKKIEAALHTVSAWRDISTAPKGRDVLVGYPNKLGNWRTVKACYYLPQTLQTEDGHYDLGDDDDGYAPAGWYEESEVQESILPTDEPPTHWMPLPAPPGIAAPVSEPLDMVLHCPKCGAQHIDAPEGQFYPGHTGEESQAVNEYHGLWNNPPHRSHLCNACGCIWRPADVPTNGVWAVTSKGRGDNWDNTFSPPVAGDAQKDAARDPGGLAWLGLIL